MHAPRLNFSIPLKLRLVRECFWDSLNDVPNVVSYARGNGPPIDTLPWLHELVDVPLGNQRGGVPAVEIRLENLHVVVA